MESSSLTRYVTGVVPLSILSVLLLLSLILMHAATQNSALFSNMYTSLLVINIIGAVLLLTLISVNVYTLILRFRAKEPGSHLTLRLLSMLVLLAVVPVTVVFFFSLQALNRGIDSWFDVRIEQAMDDALNLGRDAFDALKEEMIETTRNIALDLENTSDKLALPSLNYHREQHRLSELTLYTQNGRIIASSGEEALDTQSLIPSHPSDTILAQIRQGLTYANLDPVGETELRLRVVVPVYSKDVQSPLRILQVLQPLPGRYSKLGESVQSAFAEYEKLAYLRGPLKFGFTLTLSLVALLTMLIAITSAIVAARRLVAPIRNLAEGTEAVARGDYDKQLPVKGEDEFSVLVRSFNEMTRHIQQAQNEIQLSRAQAEMQRTYLETVLAHLSSGVISLDNHLNLLTYNIASEQILSAELEHARGNPLSLLKQDASELAPFVDTISDSVSEHSAEWGAEIAIMRPTGKRILLLRGAAMPILSDNEKGYVIVFDDITALLQAQRDAAWSEVARRLAHEIKNPLTPIQLSAERVRHKLMARLNQDDQPVLERATRTIIDQVEAMKTMVNEFAAYARPAQLQTEAVQINSLIVDVLTLYGTRKRKDSWLAHDGKYMIHLELEETLPPARADPEKLRQVLHNLLRNANDALAGVEAPVVVFRTRYNPTGETGAIELQVRDNGPGFAPELMDQLFEPYVTSKEKGTGLGLAIVKKIIEEHNGILRAENSPDGGASITIQLPQALASADEDDIRADRKNLGQQQ